MYAAEGCFFPFNNFSVSALIDFAAAVGAYFEAWFYGNGD